MVYEWDAKRARRVRVVKRSAVFLATFCLVAMPLWIAVRFGLIG